MTDHSDTHKGGEVNRILSIARMLGMAGYLVFPCRPFSKMPATRNGFKDASSDLIDIDAWFANDRGYNLAVACGPQPNGVNLLAVDIDPKNGGLETWRALTDEHGVPLAPRHETPSDGFHVFFDVPDRCRAAACTCWVRGSTPVATVATWSCRPRSCTTTRARSSPTAPRAAGTGREPAARRPAVADGDARPRAADGGRCVDHPSQSAAHPGIPSPTVPVKAGTGTRNCRPTVGRVVRTDSGTDSQWTRPGKNPREGTSATLHGPTVRWWRGRRRCPRVAWRLERGRAGPTRRGTTSSRSALAGTPRWLLGWSEGRRYPRGRERSRRPRSTLRPSCIHRPTSTTSARGWQACRQMAQSVGGSPSAHMLAYLPAGRR